jgi:hypothetical protein
MTAIAAVLAVGLFSCGGSTDEGEPTGTLVLGSTEAAGTYLTIGATAYAGLAGGGTCDDDSAFTGLGCTLLDANGTAAATNLCLGTWDFTGINVFDAGDSTCTASTIAVCDDVSGFVVGPGSNVVNVVCYIEGASVTFDVSFQ